MERSLKNTILVIVIIFLFIANSLFIPGTVVSDEPLWLPSGWHLAPFRKEHISLNNQEYVAYPVAKDGTQNELKNHTWIIFDSNRNVVTNKDAFEKLCFTAEYSKLYKDLRETNLNSNFEVELRDTYNKALTGLRTYAVGRLVVVVGSEIEGIIAKIYVHNVFSKILGKKPPDADALKSFSGIGKAVIADKFDMLKNIQHCKKWLGKESIKSPSDAIALSKLAMVIAAYNELIYARNATNSLIDMLNRNITNMSYEEAKEFRDDFFASNMGDPVLAFLDVILPPTNWKSLLGLIGNKFLDGFIGISAEDLINDYKFFSLIFGKNAPDSPMKKAFEEYNKRKAKYLSVYDVNEEVNVDDKNTTAYELYYDILKQYQNSSEMGDNLPSSMVNAKFVLRVKTNASIDFGALLNDSNIPNPTKLGNYVVWEEPLNKFIPHPNKGTGGFVGYPKNIITLKFAVDSSGDFYIGSFGGTDEDHLFLFVNGGTNNYHDFNGNYLNQSVFGTPKDRMLDLNIRNNYLGWILSNTYVQLYKDSVIKTGPSNYAELYNCPAFLYNNTGKKVVVIDSYIYNEQEDFSWFRDLCLPIVCDMRNVKWSPIANNIDQDANLSRSFDISYTNPQGSYLKIYTWTDNGMHGDVTIYGLKNPPDYTSSGSNYYGHRWSITYDRSNNSYNVHNEDAGTCTVYLKSQYPNHVEMSDFTTWSSVEQNISIAIFGDDIRVSNLKEGPSHDDGNSVPEKLIINPGENTLHTSSENFQLPDSSNSFFDDFSQGLNKWVLFGSPKPEIDENDGNPAPSFNNNGDPNYDSGAHSIKIFNPIGKVLEGDFKIVPHSDGCWTECMMGFAKPGAQYYDGAKSPWLVAIDYQYVGDACWAASSDKKRHGILGVGFTTENGQVEGKYWKRDDLLNYWHHYKIEILPNRYVKFYVDGKLIYSSINKLMQINDDVPILLGKRSYYGDSLIDNIKLQSLSNSQSDQDNQTGSTTLLRKNIWPMFRYNSLHTGQYPYSTKNNNGTLKWKYKIGDSVFSSPAISQDGTIYVGSYDHYLYALNPDGTLKWKYKTGDLIHSSPVIFRDRMIYVGSDDDNLYALNPDGTLKWKYKTGDGITSSPAIALDGTIYVGSDDDNLYALNPDGTLKWKYKTGGWIYSSPAIASDGTIYIGSSDHYLYAFKPNGTMKWKYQTEDVIASSPAIALDGTIYVGSGDYCLYALNPDGTLKWKYGTGSVIVSSPTIASDGTIYIGSDDDYFYALNPDGTLKWEYKIGSIGSYNSWIGSSPAISLDGVIYVGSNDGCLYAIGTP